MSVVLGAEIGEFKAAMATAKSELKGLVQFGEGMKSVGESMTMYLSLPIALAGVEAVRAFDKQTLAVAQVENGLRSTGNAAKLTSDQLQAMAAQIQKKSVYGDEEVLQKVTTQLLTFSNISGQTFARTQQAAVDLSAKLGQDLQTSAIQLGKALNDPTQSLGALRRAGISFSNDQIAVIHHLQATGELGKAQTIILNELERQYGGTAEAASKAGMGGLRQLGNQMNDLLESFGKIILEAINPFITRLSKLVASFDEMSEGTKKTIVTVLAVVAAMGPLLFVFGALITMLPAIIAGFTILTASFATVVLPILAVAAAVAAVVYIIYQNWDKLVAYFTKGEGGQLFAGLAQAAGQAVTAIKTAFAELANIVGGNSLGSLISFGDVLKFLFREIATGITGVLKVITGVVTLVVDLFNKDWAGAFKAGKEAVEGLLMPIKSVLGLGEQKSAGFSDFFGLVPAVKAVTESTNAAGGALVEALDKKAAAAAKKLAEELAKVANELRANTILAENLPAFLKGEGGYDGAGERIKILTNGLKKLVEDGLNPASAAFQKYLKELLTLSQAPDAKMADTPMAGNKAEVKLKNPIPPEFLAEIKIAAKEYAAQLTDVEIIQKNFLAQSNQMVANFPANALGDMFLSIGDAIAKGGNVFEAAGKSLLKSVANFMAEYGKIYLAKGVLDIAAGNPQGFAEVAAGGALMVAAGVLGGMNSGGSGSGDSSGASASGSYTPRASSAYTPSQAPNSTMSAAPAVVTHKVQVVMSGRELRGTLEYESDRLGRSTGGR